MHLPTVSNQQSPWQLSPWRSIQIWAFPPLSPIRRRRTALWSPQLQLYILPRSGLTGHRYVLRFLCLLPSDKLRAPLDQVISQNSIKSAYLDRRNSKKFTETRHNPLVSSPSLPVLGGEGIQLFVSEGFLPFDTLTTLSPLEKSRTHGKSHSPVWSLGGT